MRKAFFIPIIFMAIIFILSSIDLNTERQFLNMLASSGLYIWGRSASMQVIQNFMHFPVFGLLAFFWMNFFRKQQVCRKRIAFYALGITFLFSAFGEFHQVFVPGRDASWQDLVTNFAGCIAGISTYKITFKSKKERCHGYCCN